MKRLLLLISTFLIFNTGWSQITITSSDMPVAGDTLRFSNASITGTTISPGDSGANVAWNYSLTPTSQAIDSYLTASQVSLLYVVTVGPTAFGYKVADSIPGIGALIPVSINNIYTFFEEKSSPNSYIAKAFAANISGIPSASNYSTPDTWYFFPLTYNNNDSSQFKLNISIPGLGSLEEAGYRKSRVDGWGTIVTPYFTTPVNCIRVRQEIHQIDSIKVTTLGLSFGLPMNTVEYKWLVNGEHYPALWVTSNLTGTTETISSITYRDMYRDTSKVNNTAAPNISRSVLKIDAYPNPAADGIFNLNIPTGWNTFSVEVFDMQSKEVAVISNSRVLNLQALPSGVYLARVTSGTQVAFVQIQK